MNSIPTWLDEVQSAEHWKIVPLRRLGTLINGGTPTADDQNWGGDIPFVTPPDLNGLDGALIVSTGRTITETGAKGSSTAPAGSVIVSTRAPIGHVGRIGTTSAFNQGCRAIVVEHGADNRFVAYAFVAARPEMDARGLGTTFIELSGANLASLPIPLPPHDEQRLIADYLDRETAQIDALISEQERLIELLRERQAAILDQHFQASEGKRHATVRQTLLKLSRPSVSGLGVVTAYRDGQVTRRSNRREEGYTFSDTEAGYQEVRPGDIVFHALDGFAGAVGVSDSHGICTPVYHVCKPRYDDDPEYLALLLRYLGTSEFLAVQAPNVRQRSVDFRNWATFARVPLTLPPVEEQKAFVAHYRERRERIDALIAEVERNIALAQERRAALISEAVTGRLEPEEYS